MLFCGELNTSGTGIRIHTEFMFNLKLNQISAETKLTDLNALILKMAEEIIAAGN